jgi:hypothetical protein
MIQLNLRLFLALFLFFISSNTVIGQDAPSEADNLTASQPAKNAEVPEEYSPINSGIAIATLTLADTLVTSIAAKLIYPSGYVPIEVVAVVLGLHFVRNTCSELLQRSKAIREAQASASTPVQLRGPNKYTEPSE